MQDENVILVVINFPGCGQSPQVEDCAGKEQVLWSGNQLQRVDPASIVMHAAYPNRLVLRKSMGSGVDPFMARSVKISPTTLTNLKP